MKRRMCHAAGVFLLVTLGITGCRRNDAIVAPETAALTITITPHTAHADIGAVVRFGITRLGTDTASLNFTWNFGDGTQEYITSTDTVKHVYANEGSFRVVCLAMHSGSNTAIAADTALVVITRDGSGTGDVQIRIIPDTAHAQTGDPVQFKLERTGSDTSTLTFVWDFHDGSPVFTVHDTTISHAFNTKGIYEVTCMAYRIVGNPAIATGTSHALITEQFNFATMKNVALDVQIPILIHHDKTDISNGSHAGEILIDSTYETVTTPYDGLHDVFPDLVWNGRQFSYSWTYALYVDTASISINGSISMDGKTLESLSFHWRDRRGLSSVHVYEMDYRLSNISFKEAVSDTVRTCYVKGMALQDHVFDVNWSWYRYSPSAYEETITMLSWRISGNASIRVVFSK